MDMKNDGRAGEMTAKNIRELTELEAKEILLFVFGQDKEADFMSLSFDVHPGPNGEGQYITFDGRSIIGIEYHNGQDRCILHFDNTKCVLWLYKHGYDITELLEKNAYMSEMEKDFSNMAFGIYQMIHGRFEKDHKKRCEELYNKYYIKDYN